MTPNEIRNFVHEHEVAVVPKKSSRLMRFLAWFLALTRINKKFLDGYVTTIGKTIYYREGWEPFHMEDDNHLRAHASTFEHEFVHVRQYEKWWVLYQISYILLPIPFGLAWFRWRWEREAYYLANIKNGASIDQCVNALWRYGWPWPRSWMRRWFEKQIQQTQDPPH